MAQIMAFDRVRLKQPTMGEILRINRGNALANGLVFAGLPGFNEAVSGFPGYPVGAGSISTYKSFRALYTTATVGDGWYWRVNPNGPYFDKLSIGTTCSIAVLAKLNTIGAWGMLTGTAYRASGWTAPYDSLAFKAYSGTDYGLFEFSDSGATGYGLAGFSGYLASGETYLVTRDGTNCVWYRDGASYGSNSGAGTAVPYFPYKREITIFTRSVDSPGEGHAGYCWGAFYWNRVLSASEALRFHLNPWQVFA